MVSLARKMLLHERRRFAAAVAAVTFAGLLLVVQASLLLGMLGTVTTIVDRSAAHLWVGRAGAASVDLGRDVDPSLESFVRAHPRVVQAEKFLQGVGDWRLEGGRTIVTYLFGIDTRPGALALASLITAEQRRLLDEPGAVLIDGADVEKLGARLGEPAEVNGQRVRVVGLLDGLRAIGGANVLASLQTVRRVTPSTAGPESFTYLLARVDDPGRLPETLQELRALAPPGRLGFWAADSLSGQSQLFWLRESGVGASSGFAALLGLVVGVLVTNQVLLSVILASLREYASLRALGVPVRSLAAVVLEQAAWVGGLGVGVTAVLFGGVRLLAASAHVPLQCPPWLAAACALLVLAVALLSGLSAVRTLRKADPALLLRSA